MVEIFDSVKEININYVICSYNKQNFTRKKLSSSSRSYFLPISLRQQSLFSHIHNMM